MTAYLSAATAHTGYFWSRDFIHFVLSTIGDEYVRPLSRKLPEAKVHAKAEERSVKTESTFTEGALSEGASQSSCHLKVLHVPINFPPEMDV